MNPSISIVILPTNIKLFETNVIQYLKQMLSMSTLFLAIINLTAVDQFILNFLISFSDEFMAGYLLVSLFHIIYLTLLVTARTLASGVLHNPTYFFATFWSASFYSDPKYLPWARSPITKFSSIFFQSPVIVHKTAAAKTGFKQWPSFTIHCRYIHLFGLQTIPWWNRA